MNNVLRMENEDLKQSLQKANVDLANYKETLKNFYSHYCEQQKKIDAMRAQTNDNFREFDRFGEKNIEMQVGLIIIILAQNEVKTLVLDRDLLMNKLEIGDK